MYCICEIKFLLLTCITNPTSRHGHSILRKPIASIPLISIERVSRDDTGVDALFVSPPPVVPPADPVDLPRPVDPPVDLFVAEELCGPPPPVPGDGIGPVEREFRVPFCTVGDAETPLARDDGPVSAARVGARVAEVAVSGDFDARGPFHVVVVVVEGKGQVVEVGVGVSGPPLFVHHLYVDLVGCCDAEGGLHGADAGESCGVVLLYHAPARVAVLDRLVDELDGADVEEVGVRVYDLGDPFEPFVGALVLEVNIEAWGRGPLAREWLCGLLRAGGAVKVENDVESGVFCPLAQTLKVWEPTLWEVLAVFEHNVLVDPVPKWDAYGVETQAADLFDVVLRDPPAPVRLESGISGILA